MPEQKITDNNIDAFRQLYENYKINPTFYDNHAQKAEVLNAVRLYATYLRDQKPSTVEDQPTPNKFLPDFMQPEPRQDLKIGEGLDQMETATRELLTPETAAIYDTMKEERERKVEEAPEHYQIDSEADFSTQVKEASKETIKRLTENVDVQTFGEIQKILPIHGLKLDVQTQESNDKFIEAFNPLFEALDPKKEDPLGKRLGKEAVLFAIMAPYIPVSMLDDPIKTTRGITEFFLSITNDWIEAIKSPINPTYNPFKTQKAREEIARTPLFHTIPFLGIGGAFKVKIAKMTPKGAKELSTKLAKDVVKEAQHRELSKPFKPFPEDISKTSKARAEQSIKKTESERQATIPDPEKVETMRKETIPEESKVTPKEPKPIIVEPKVREQLDLVNEINTGLKDAGLAIKIKIKSEDVELTDALNKLSKGDKTPEVRNLVIEKLEAIKADEAKGTEPTPKIEPKKEAKEVKPEVEKVVEKEAKKEPKREDFDTDKRKISEVKGDEIVVLGKLPNDKVWYGDVGGGRLQYNGSLIGEFKVVKKNPKTTRVERIKDGKQYVISNEAGASKDLKEFVPSTPKTVEKPKETVITPKKAETPVESKLDTEKPIVETETKVSGVAQSIEARAIEAGLTERFKDLAEFPKTTIKEQSALMSDLMKDTGKTKRVIAGAEPLPKGLNPATVVASVENYALATKNGELISELAKSPLVAETSTSGLTLRLLQERSPFSPVRATKEIIKLREKGAERKLKFGSPKKIKTQDKKSLKSEISKVKFNKNSWESLVREIICA